MRALTWLSFQNIRIFGARLHVHWTVFVAALVLLVLAWRQPLLAGITVCCYYAMLLLHEAGHAWVARRVGCRPLHIQLGVFHGRCTHEAADSPKDAALIAWGGVAAQVLVALPLLALGALTPAMTVPGLKTAITILGFYSLLVAAINLLPVRFLDGDQAWRLLPILADERRRKRKVRSAASRGIRRIK